MDNYKKRIVGVTEVNGYNLMMINTGGMINIETILNIFKIPEIDHHSIMTPSLQTEAVLVEKVDMYEALEFHKSVMNNISDNVDKFYLNINREIEDTFNDINGFIIDDEFDFYMLITTDKPEFDISTYASTFEAADISTYMKLLKKKE